MNKDKSLLGSIDSESNDRINQFIKILRKVCNRRELNLHEPFFSGNETKYLEECVSTNFVSSVGIFVSKFEKMLSKLTGAKHVIATVNGTSALHLSLLCLGIGFKDEVLLPALTFVGSANSIRYCNATPHFCDISEDDLNLDLDKLRDHLKFTAEKHHVHSINKYTNNRIAAIMPVHVYGQPVDMETLLSIASEYKLTILEDAAESLGSFLNKKHTGTFGEIGCLSFNGNKIVTTGGGGAILTDDDMLAKQIRHMSTTAKIAHPWELSHDEIGYNYRMPNINAALGCAQLELFSNLLENKRNLHMKYKKELDGIPWLRLISENKESISNYWLNTVILKNNEDCFQKRLIETCHKEKIFLRPSWKPLHLLPMFQSFPKSELNTASFLQKKIVNLPSSAFL